MLSVQNVLKNRIRLADYEKAQYLCKNKQDFCDCLASPVKVAEFALLCDSLGLELQEQRVDYYPVELVGEQSPYFNREDKGDFDEYGFPFPSSEACYAFIVDEFNCPDFLAHVEPVQLELFEDAVR